MDKTHEKTSIAEQLIERRKSLKPIDESTTTTPKAKEKKGISSIIVFVL